MLLILSEFIELAETVAIDDLLKVAIGIVANKAVVIEDHQLAVLGGIGLPGGEARDVRIAVVGELCPDAAHRISQFQVGCRRLRQLIG